MNSEEKQNTNRRKLIVGLLLLLLGSSGMFLGYRLFYQPVEVGPDEVVAGQYVKDMTSDDLLNYLQEKADKNYVHLQVSSTMTFSEGKETGTVLIKNSPKNSYSIRMISYINGQKTKIYDSGLVAPSQYVHKGKLLKDVAKGTHKINSMVKYYDADKKLVGQSTVVGTLMVDN